MHSAFKSFRFYNATATDLEGFESIRCSGGLEYPGQDGSTMSAWVGGYFGEDRLNDPPAPWPKRWQQWDRSKLKAFASALTSRVLMVNIEHYGDDGLGRLVDLLETVREFRPDVAIGVWSLLPASEWWTVQNWIQYIDWQAGRPHLEQASTWWRKVGPARIDAFGAWKDRSRLAARKLLPHVDALFPSIYPVYDIAKPGDEWKLARNVEVVVEESIEIAAGAIPVLPVLYPIVSSSKARASLDLVSAFAAATRKADGFTLWSDRAVEGPALIPYAETIRKACTF